MAGPRKVSQEQYDKLRSKMEEQYDYENMSDEKKAQFNAEFDKIVVPENNKTDNNDNNDATDPQDDGEEAEKGEFEDGIPKENEDGNEKENDDDDGPIL